MTHKIVAAMVFVLLIPLQNANADETLYVQASKTDLRQTPAINGAKSSSVARGDRLSVLETQGIWYRVSTDSKHQGWISKLFVSKTKPVGAADLDQEAEQTLEHASRRRSSSFAVSTSTRGLNTSAHAQDAEGDGMKTDYPALKEVEDYSLKQDMIDKFKSSGKLTTE